MQLDYNEINNASNPTETFNKLVGYYHELNRNSKHAEVSDLLKSVGLNVIDVYVKHRFLAATVVYRNVDTSWNTLYLSVHRRFTEMGLDAAFIMRDLDVTTLTQ